MSLLRSLSERLSFRRRTDSGDDDIGEVTLSDRHRQTLFEACTSSGHAEEVRMVLEGLPSLNINRVRFGQTGDTALHLAARQGNTALSSFLINSVQADVNARNKDGHTPLHLAAALGHCSYCFFLIDTHGADLNVKDFDWRGTPVHLAVQHGRKEFVQTCLERYGIDVNMPDGYAGDALLHWAAWYGNSNMISMLIEEFKASPNVKNQGGQTPIQYAAMMGKRELVMLLAGKYKADVNVQSRAKGFSPLHYAAGNDHVGVVKLLVEDYGANVHLKDNEWRTARDLAKDAGSLQTAEYLDNVPNQFQIRLNKLRDAGCEIEKECPDDFICPITFCIMSDPMVALDGYTYEGACIKDWFRQCCRSPKTNQELSQTLVIPNHLIKQQIVAWVDEKYAEYSIS